MVTEILSKSSDNLRMTVRLFHDPYVWIHFQDSEWHSRWLQKHKLPQHSSWTWRTAPWLRIHLRNERISTCRHLETVNVSKNGEYLTFWLIVWDFKFSLRRVWCSELSSGIYCRVKWLSTDVSEVRTHPWWWRQYAPLKRRLTIILHGSISQ
jgi:hypothetical protein